MTARVPLPPPLSGTAFTVAELREAGLPWDRTRASDLRRLCRGVHTPGDPDALTWDRAAAVCRLTGGVVSHTTAAAWHGLPLPARLGRSTALHLSFDHPRRQHRSLLAGVVSHRVRLPDDEVLSFPDGLRVTTPERTWIDLAAVLRPVEQDWMVAVADALLCPPWHPDGRLAPASTPPRLMAALALNRGRRGLRRARAALELARIGADSPPETFLRLALIRAGLPEPELQVTIDPSDPHSPDADLGYRSHRISLQYDGATHRTPQQQARDARREAYCLERDWLPVRSTDADLRTGFARVVGIVGRRVIAGGAPSSR